MFAVVSQAGWPDLVPADLLARVAAPTLLVLSGDDALTLPFMAVGAEGVISVASNLFVREISQMVRHALANDSLTFRVRGARRSACLGVRGVAAL